MRIESLKLVYFSPTGTTEKIVEAIARGINHDSVETLNITRPENRQGKLATSENELLIVGVPVYFGRAQSNAIEWLSTMQGSNTPTVCVVVYGNRAFDDALLELKDTMMQNGCIPVACAAYIGEHSFSSSETPIAAGRPDDADLVHAESFGEKIKNKLASVSKGGLASDISVPGNHPYADVTESRKNLSAVDLVAVDSTCSKCGECARICPVEAIDFEDSALVDRNKCIVCHACVKYCTTGARAVKDEMMKNIAHRLSDALQTRKEPVILM